LFESDVGQRQEFEAIALSSYARLNEERRGIDEAGVRGAYAAVDPVKHSQARG
jgi:hypothetical protein